MVTDRWCCACAAANAASSAWAGCVCSPRLPDAAAALVLAAWPAERVHEESWSSATDALAVGSCCLLWVL